MPTTVPEEPVIRSLVLEYTIIFRVGWRFPLGLRLIRPDTQDWWSMNGRDQERGSHPALDAIVHKTLLRPQAGALERHLNLSLAACAASSALRHIAPVA